MLEEVAAYARLGQSFAFETTLSGLALSLPNAEIAIARVAERVRQGGHNIPEPVILRRFAAGLKNFEQR